MSMNQDIAGKRNFLRSALEKVREFGSNIARRISPKAANGPGPATRKSRTRPNRAAQDVRTPGPPPIAPRSRLLPFYSPEYSWETFEAFFCDFLAASPELIGRDGKACRIVTTSLYGRRGDNQHGIDIRAEMANGEVWVFQCKHYKSWGPKDTTDAIEKCTYMADRKYLLVTRAVSPETREIVAKKKDWVVWDSDDISREFLLRLSPDVAARLLYTSFGPSWPMELLGLPGLSPFISAEAKFAPLIEDGRTFHHRLALVGRMEWLQKLDDFINNERRRVFLLCGRGGLGKSRILREWSHEFSSRHKGWTLRFVSDSPEDFGTALDSSPHPLALVFDDAHRLDEVRRVLFRELPSRKDVKLVLSLRPGPVEQVETELIEAGFDVTHIERPDQLNRLSSEEALELAEAALGTSLAERFRLRLRDLSRECPLLAVLAAELLKRGELVDRDFNDTDEFRIRVFKGLLKEVEPVNERFGAQPTNDFLRLLAVLAPVKIDADFLRRAATFLGGDTQPSQISDMLEALANVGLILATGAGVRVTPDLLSDHLAYTACYDKHAHNTTFADRVFQQFSSDQFPCLMQHIAEAEWRALQKDDSADSVVEPIWQWFLQRFEASSFYSRHNQLKQWANISHLQPRRTLELARRAVQLKVAPPDEPGWIWRSEWNTPANVLSSLPALLKRLAMNNPESVSECLDILWEIGQDLPPPPLNAQGHPISTIGEIASYGGGRFPAVQRKVLGWLERLLGRDDWTHSSNKPGWLLSQMLHPFFATSLEESWRSGRTFSWRSRPLHLGNTAEFRDGVLGLCRNILARKSIPLALGVLEVLDPAIRPARIPNYKVTPEFERAWLIERRKALAILAEVRQDYNAPVIQFRLRRILLQQLQHDGTDFRADCRTLFNAIEDTLDLRMLRALLGNYINEFDRPSKDRPNDWHDEATRRWEQFVRDTAEALLSAWPDLAAFLAKLADLHAELTHLDIHPNFDVIFRAIANRQPQTALDLASHLISQPDHPLASAVGILTFEPTATQLDRRLSLCEEAVASGSDELAAGAIECFALWRRDGVLPEPAWLLLQNAAESASSRVAGAIAWFVQVNGEKLTLADWDLLVVLPVTPEEWRITNQVLDCSADLLEKNVIPAPELAAMVLATLDHMPSLASYGIERGLKQFAKHFPGRVFLLMWRRYQFKLAGESNLEAVPDALESINFANVLADPDAAAVVDGLEHRLIDGVEMPYEEQRILQIVIMQSGQDPESHLLRLLDMASTPEQLKRLAGFAEERRSWPIVLECPEFTRRLLARARALGEDCHKELFRDLVSLPGARGFGSSEPDDNWKDLVDAIENMAASHATDPELGPLYAACLKHERDWIADMRKSGIERERALDEDLD